MGWFSLWLLFSVSTLTMQVPAAALVIDGEVVAAVAEERLNRIKYYARFPKQAIAAVLSMANLKAQDIDPGVIPRNTKANLIPKFKYLLNHPHLASAIDTDRKKTD